MQAFVIYPFCPFTLSQRLYGLRELECSFYKKKKKIDLVSLLLLLLLLLFIVVDDDDDDVMLMLLVLLFNCLLVSSTLTFPCGLLGSCTLTNKMPLQRIAMLV